MRASVTGWHPVIFANEVDTDGNCPVCKTDYAECPCPGPTQEDEFEYRDVRGVLMARPKQDTRIISQITDIRANNNVLWMHLLEIALKHAPKEAKVALRNINENDRLISGLLVELAK